MKKTDINTPEKFLQRRGISVDGSYYKRALMESLQTFRHLRSLSRSGEVSASLGDLIDFIENEIAYISHVEGDGRK